MRASIVIAAILLVTLAASPARADVGVVVTGEATMQPQLASQLELWLKTHGHKLVATPLPTEAINRVIDCFVTQEKRCAPDVIDAKSKSQVVVFAQVNVQTGATALERTLILTAHWFEKGKESLVRREFCERCTEATLRSTADKLMLDLATSAPGGGRLTLSSTPAGARVLVAGTQIGTTPLDHVFAPGEHELVLDTPGRTRETRKVTIVAGELTAVEVAFAPLLEAPPESARARVLPWALIGAGTAVAIGGAIVYAVDEDDAPANEPKFRDTAPWGIGIAAAGLATAAVGAYLLVTGRTSESSAPVATALPGGGGAIGWSGRF